MRMICAKQGLVKMANINAPKYYIGLLVGIGGYAIGYDIYEGNIYEGHTLIPFIEKISRKFNLDKPVIVADAGLLSNDNIKALEASDYEYILGARIKNESEKIKNTNIQKFHLLMEQHEALKKSAKYKTNGKLFWFQGSKRCIQSKTRS